MNFCLKFFFLAALLNSALFTKTDSFHYANSSSYNNDNKNGELSKNSNMVEDYSSTPNENRIEENATLKIFNDTLTIITTTDINTETTTEIYSTTTENIVETSNDTETNTESTIYDSSTNPDFEKVDKEIVNDTFITSEPRTESTEYSIPYSDSTSEGFTTSENILTNPTTRNHQFYKKTETKVNDDESEDTTPTSSSTEFTESTTESPLGLCEELNEVTSLTITPSNFSLHVKWSNPKPECDYKYLVQWEVDDKIIKLDQTDKNEYLIEKLNACEKYTVSVQILDKKNSPNKPVSNSSETLDAILPVENLKHHYDEKEKKLLVTWDIPNTVKKCHNANIVKSMIEDNSMTLEISINQFKFLEVNSCNNYEISVRAISKGNNISSEQSINFTNPIINDPPIFNLNELDIQDDFVITKWNFGKNICRPQEFTVTCTSEDAGVITEKGEIDVINKKLTANITNVEAYTNYSCTGKIKNTVGASENSEPGTFTTNNKPPGLPKNIKTEEQEKSVLIKWSPPDKWNGEPSNYKVEVDYIGLNYNLVEGCSEEKPDSCSEILSSDQTEFYYENVIPAAKYKISVTAASFGEWGNENTNDFTSGDGIPEKPANLVTKILDAKTVHYNVSLEVKWETPCKMNGKLKQYFVQLSEIGGNNSFSNDIEPLDSKNYSYLFPNLKPETSYEVIVLAKNSGNNDGQPSNKMIESPAGIPKKIIEENLIEPNPSISEEPWKSAVVYISNNIFDEINGKIQYYSIIVGTQNCLENPTHGSYNFEDIETWPIISSDNSSCPNDARAYEATPKMWNPLKNSNDADVFKFLLGENESCIEVDCNKPLTPSTQYFIKIRGFTKHGYTDTKLLSLETAMYADVPVGLIIGLVVGILVIAIIIATVLFYTKGKLNFKNWPRGNSVNQISPAPLPVPLKKFSSHYENMMENPGKIKNEFQLLSTISSDVTLSTKTALLPMNKKKNRYINILPYDQTRVTIAVTNTNSTDYINASFIKGYNGNNEYIATQGPTEQTCPAFWQMVMEQNVKLIVMLTQFVELGKEKCYKYFPDIKEEYELLNNINIVCLEEQLLDTYCRRVFQLRDIDKPTVIKKVTHIQFIQWPDFGVPDELHHMVEFCEIMKDIRRKERGTTVMHCSAGVGRTGTLIAVDILLQSIKDKRKVDIFGTVLNLRKQRMNMVQSEKQYEFLYKITYYIITNNVSNPPSKDSLVSISESDML